MTDSNIGAAAVAEPMTSRSRAGQARAVAKNVERPLRAVELFFSTTDAKGVITSGNDVFSRVSGYSLEEMLGRAHNIVRHPDMPRAVFQVLWDTISEGRPIVAYVKNRTADGAFYWVLASVAPIDDGYLSVRLAPSTSHFEAVKGIYAELVALERSIEGDDVRRRKPAIAASTERLGELLRATGFDDYREFMCAVLPAEVAARAELLPDGHAKRLEHGPDRATTGVAEILTHYRAMSSFLHELVSDLGRYAEVGRALGDESRYLKTMGDDVRIFALNAQIGASRLGAHGAALDAVARLLTAQSQATSPLVATVADRAAAAVREIETMTFELALSTIQSEMIAVFAHELADGDVITEDAARAMTRLADALQGGGSRTFESLNRVARQLAAVMEHVDSVSIGIERLSRLALNGRIELASVPDAGSIGTLFNDVELQVGDARDRLTAFDPVDAVAHDLQRAANHPAMHAPEQLHRAAETLASAEPVGAAVE